MIKKVILSLLILLLGISNVAAHNGERVGYSSYNFHPSWNSWVQQPLLKHTHSFKLHHKGRIQTRHRPSTPILPKNSPDLATVSTAAGIPITVNRTLVNQFQGFISDLVKTGYTPKHISCWAASGHVANSNHYHGGACDFDQWARNKTNASMYHVAALASKWNLRDGCSFRSPDCGHIDDGTNIGWKHPNNIIARYIDWQTTPVTRSQRQQQLETFEE